MTLLGPIVTPLRALAFALGGALLAWTWFNLGPWVPILIVSIVWLLTGALQAYASSQIPTKPLRALKLMEWRLLGIVVVSAAAAALVIVLAVAFTLTDQQEEAISVANREVISAVGAALAAFIGAMSISAEAADEHIGDLVKSTFRQKFVTDANPAPGQGRIATNTEAGIKADRALNSSMDYGWTDWSRDTRRERVEAIDAYINPS